MNQRSCVSKYIFDSSVWYSSVIRIGGKDVFIDGWCLNGIIKIENFLTILSRQDFAERFRLFHTPSMEYNNV